jgi:hypothetical protein
MQRGRFESVPEISPPLCMIKSVLGDFPDCFGSLRNSSVCFGCFDIGSKHRNKPKKIFFLVSQNKPKQTRNRSCFGLFRFEPKLFFFHFEDTLVGTVRLSSVGIVRRSSVGTVRRSSVGTVRRSSVGTVRRISVGTVRRSSVGSVRRSSVGTVRRSSVGTVRRSSVGLCGVAQLVLCGVAQLVLCGVAQLVLCGVAQLV